jgi:ion channel-forming bestrophin family protein
MIITRNIRIERIIRGTWKTSLLIIIVCVAAYIFNEYFLKHYFNFPPIVDAILGPALAFFIGFSNNQAYDRWWEARKIWGTLVNDSRTWARQVIFYTSAPTDRDSTKISSVQKRAVYRHIAFLYALKDSLRGENKKEYRRYISGEESEVVERETNIHNAILSLQSKELNDMYKKSWLDGFGFIELNKMLISFSNEMGKSERIKNTVFPPTYSYYTLMFIWILVVSMTIVISNTIGAWSILFGVLIGYVFLTTHNIGQALLNPFEPIPTGVSLDQITRTIEINLLEAIGETEIPEPVKSVDNEYIM